MAGGAASADGGAGGGGVTVAPPGGDGWGDGPGVCPWAAPNQNGDRPAATVAASSVRFIDEGMGIGILQGK
jgi:hypothetical protein